MIGYDYPGNIRIQSASIFNLVGSVTNDSGNAGSVGEVVTSNLASGSAVSVTTDGVYNITNLSLTPGDWDVRGHVNFWAQGATITQLVGGLGTTSSGMPSDGTEIYAGERITVLTGVDSVSIPEQRFSLSAQSTVYLMGRSVFSAGLISGFGGMSARRVR